MICVVRSPGGAMRNVVDNHKIVNPPNDSGEIPNDNIRQRYVEAYNKEV